MKWDRGHQSSNLEDRRGQSYGGGGGGGGGGAMLLARMLASKGGWGLIAALAIVGYTTWSNMRSTTSAPATPEQSAALAADPQRQMVAFVLDDAQDTWARIFQAKGQQYTPAKLVLFSGRTPTACGTGQAGMGPFYCPPDQRVYIDLSFFEELDRRFGAPGDFAQAYVVAHELGHHVQNVLGLNEKAERAPLSAGESKNQRSIAIELQADCFAGVWGNATKKRDLLEAGDIEEGLKAASAVGDDVLQKRGQGDVTPETWTHGSAADRMKWFKRGFESGDPASCVTSSLVEPTALETK
jgi:hypothetical protein